MSDDSALPAKLCYAPPARIPHPPHAWHDLDLADAAAHPDEPIKVHAWYCDGWTAITSGWTASLIRATAS